MSGSFFAGWSQEYEREDFACTGKATTLDSIPFKTLLTMSSTAFGSGGIWERARDNPDSREDQKFRLGFKLLSCGITLHNRYNAKSSDSKQRTFRWNTRHRYILPRWSEFRCGHLQVFSECIKHHISDPRTTVHMLGYFVPWHLLRAIQRGTFASSWWGRASAQWEDCEFELRSGSRSRW